MIPMHKFYFFTYFILFLSCSHAQTDYVEYYNQCLLNVPAHFTNYSAFFKNTNSEGFVLPMQEQCLESIYIF